MPKKKAIELLKPLDEKRKKQPNEVVICDTKGLECFASYIEQGNYIWLRHPRNSHRDTYHTCWESLYKHLKGLEREVRTQHVDDIKQLIRIEQEASTMALKSVQRLLERFSCPIRGVGSHIAKKSL